MIGPAMINMTPQLPILMTFMTAVPTAQPRDRHARSGTPGKPKNTKREAQRAAKQARKKSRR